MKKIVSIFLLLIFAVIFSGCSPKGEAFNFTAFGSPVHIEVYGKLLPTDIKEQIKAELNQIEEEFSVSLPTSLAAKLNANQSVNFSAQFLEVFSLAKEYYTLTGGLFNPAVYPLNKLWHFDTSTKVSPDEFTPPTQAEIDGVLNDGALDFNKIYLKNGEIIKENPQIAIDFGGILKGYACDKICKILADNGFTEGYISLGSSSMSLLGVETLSLRHPEKTGVIAKLNCVGLKNVAVSTSGNYEKYYDYNGVRYSHIINPKSGKPYANKVLSATVLGKDGAFIDAMTTALCLTDYEDILALTTKITEKDDTAKIFIVYSFDGKKQFITNEKQGNFTLLDDSYSVVNV